MSDTKKDSNNYLPPSIPIALTPQEFDQLRRMLASWDRLEKMIVAHERAEWFWSSLGIWVKWVFGAITAVAAFVAILKGWAK